MRDLGVQSEMLTNGIVDLTEIATDANVVPTFIRSVYITDVEVNGAPRYSPTLRYASTFNSVA